PGLRVQRRPLGHSPTLKRAVQFQAEVVMQPRGVVLLNAVLQRTLLATLARSRAAGLRRRTEIPFAVVFLQGHGVAGYSSSPGSDAGSSMPPGLEWRVESFESASAPSGCATGRPSSVTVRPL